MGKPKSKRRRIRLFSFAAAVVLALSVFAIAGTVRANRYERQLRASGERALAELDDSLSSMQTNLQKGVYANTAPMLGTMATELWREATSAKSSLAVLPLSDTRLDNTYKFLSQVGDFVMSLSRKVEAGEQITDDERQQMFALLDFAETLSTQISDMRTQLYEGFLDFTAAENTLAADAEQIGTLSGDMEDTEQALTEYPSLIYDGPFSDHINQMESELLAEAEELTQEQAHERAAEILGLSKDALTFVGTEEDNSAAYVFGTEDATIAVTKRGGYLLYLLSGSFVGEATLQYEDARTYAADFLTHCGFTDMQESYYTVSDGICTINYAYTENGYICYPDLIKVSVSLADGTVLSADCRGYVMNHKARTYTAPAVTREAAEANVSPLLTVTDTRLAVIPTDSGGEALTYEFHCKNESDKEFLVYISTQTGYEEEILLLLYADDGVLTK